MEFDKSTRLSRREFMVMALGSGAGFALGMALPGCSRETSTAPEAGPGKAGDAVQAAGAFEPNAFIRISPDNRVTVIIKHLEMGQGTYTGLATLVAEELDAAWSQIDVEGAPANADIYNNLFWGKVQGTGGSTAIANSYEQMRKAGAAAREMLIAAAAEKWGVPDNEVNAQEGVVSHQATANSATFGELAELAARQAVPGDVLLKDPEEFRLIGTRLPRKDSKAKTSGSAMFTQDVKLPEMLTALVAHPPRFGAKVSSFDAADSLAVDGVETVVQIPNGVAVLARDFWAAKKGRDALQIDWDESQAFALGSRQLMDRYRSLAETPGVESRSVGDTGKAMQNATQRVEATTEFPFLAHATLEPMNCVMQRQADGVEVWNGEQFQTPDQIAIAGVFGIRPDQVRINMLYAGGSFGRRANPQSDYLVETASIIKAGDIKVPVKLVWTREDDMRAGYYRPMYFHKLRAGLDENGIPVAWKHSIVGQSIMNDSPFEEGMVTGGVDVTSVEGASNMPYSIPNIDVELHTTQLPVPVQWWRSVGSTHTAFAIETFIDQLARLADRDPVEYRRAMLQSHPRHLAVMSLAAEKANWGSPMEAGRGRGIAVHESFNTCVAQVAEVSVMSDNRFTVDRVVIAVDCGIAVNPDVVVAQMEGGMGYGLAAALDSEITLDKGRIVQSNFHDYRVLRMNQMPEVEVHIVKSPNPPTGVGEPATPVIAPAVANALTAATGQHFNRLPLRLGA